jgi:hypothetical protein
MSSRPQKVSFNLHAQGLTAAKSSTLLTTGKANRDSASLNSISLEPFSVYIGKIEK